MAAQDRRRQLLDVSRDLVNTDGFDGLTVEAVARKAGVTRPVVYDLFGDLDGLVTALIDREQQIALAPLLNLVGHGDPTESTLEDFLERALTGFLEAVHADKQTWQLVLMPPQRVSEPIRRRFHDSRELLAARLTQLVRWGFESRGGPTDLDWDLLGRLVVAAGEDAARLTLLNPRRYKPERLVLGASSALTLLPGRPGSARKASLPDPPVLSLPEPAAPKQAAPTSPKKRMARAERREQLMDVALQLIDEGDWDALSVDAIAKAAGVDRVVVYRSFGRLELLVVALLAREEQRTRGLVDAIVPAKPVPGTPSEILGGAVAGLLEEVLSKPLTYRVALRRPESLPPALRKIVNARRASIAKRLRPLVELGLAGVDAPTEDIDVELLSRMILTAGEELARLALHEPDFPPERVLTGTWGLLALVPAR